ncbi:MAG: prolyl oligopeptidase family serine peptidase, partial [Planctomycetota bacterium]
SPDGRYLAFYREDQRPIDAYPYQDPLAMPPALRHGRYPMAGRNDSIVTVGIYDAVEGALRWLEHDDALDLYWTNVTFAPDGKSLVVALVSRGQDQLELARFDCSSGRRTGTLLSEHDKEWVEPEHGPWFLPDGRFLWWSSGDGHRHLYLHGNDGARLLQVTKGAFDVQELLEVDAARGSLWFSASGEDPRQLHLLEAKLDGSEVKQVTRDRGTHRCSLAPDARFAFVTWSNLETPPQPRFVDLQTGAVEPLPQAPVPLLDYELPQSRMFQVKADDDTVLYGNVLLPRDVAEGQKLPTLLYVYGGPHLQQVTDSWLGNASLWLHALCNHGYVVCRLDNRGTPHRGIEFEQSVFRKLGTLEVSDQLRAVEWLKQQPFVDGTRVGVHGWSYGGYMTLRLLGQAPGTFRCGVSGAPVTDWAMYETGYTERYMDMPSENGEGYAGSSCLLLAEKLQDRLLVVHGTDDRTVMWSHTLQFVDRCVKAGKFVDYMPYANQTHRLVGADKVHFQRVLKEYLDRWLAGK